MSLESILIRWLERLETRAWSRSVNAEGLRESIWRSILIVLRGIITDRAFERAGYLTYLALLSLVPFVALMLSISEMLGWGKTALAFIVHKLAITAPELSGQLSETIQGLDFVALGLIALVAIVIAGFIALVNFEGIIDDIWAAQDRRPLWRTLTLYPLLMFVAPTVAAFVLTIAAVGQVQSEELMITFSRGTFFGTLLRDRLQEISFLFRVAPILLICGTLFLVYKLVPSSKVRWQSAVIAGVVAGLGWHLVQAFYLNFQFATGSYRAIWGLLAQIPLLLLWVYASWMILIAGVELSFAWQHRHTYLPKAPVDNLSAYASEHAIVEIARVLVKSNKDRPHGMTSAEISNRLRIPWSLVRRHLASLTAIGAVHTVRAGSESTYFSADELGNWTISDILQRWRKSGDQLPEIKRHETHWPDDMTLDESIQKPTKPS